MPAPFNPFVADHGNPCRRGECPPGRKDELTGAVAGSSTGWSWACHDQNRFENLLLRAALGQLPTRIHGSPQQCREQRWTRFHCRSATSGWGEPRLPAASPTTRVGYLTWAQPSTWFGLRASGPTYWADGRTNRPVHFCSRTCADQPAVRAQVNMAGIIGVGTPAKSRITAAQNSTFVS